MEDSLKLLQREFSVSWHRVIQGILIARLSAGLDQWPGVSRACRKTKKTIAKMPAAGGPQGFYGQAYLSLLDGIAHTRAVESGYSEDYLRDAFVRLENAWTEL